MGDDNSVMVVRSIFTWFTDKDFSIEYCGKLPDDNDKTECFKDHYFETVAKAKKDFSKVAGAFVDRSGKLLTDLAVACPNVLLSDDGNSDILFSDADSFSTEIDKLHGCMHYIEEYTTLSPVGVDWKKIRDVSGVDKKNTEPPMPVLPSNVSDAYFKHYVKSFTASVLKWAQQNRTRFNDQQLQKIAFLIDKLGSADKKVVLEKYAEAIVAIDAEVRGSSSSSAFALKDGFDYGPGKKAHAESAKVGKKYGNVSLELAFDLAKINKLNKDDVGTLVRGDTGRSLSNIGFKSLAIKVGDIPVSVLDGERGQTGGDVTMAAGVEATPTAVAVSTEATIALNSFNSVEPNYVHSLTPKLTVASSVEELTYDTGISLEYVMAKKRSLLANLSLSGGLNFILGHENEPNSIAWEAGLSATFYFGENIYLTPSASFGDPIGGDMSPDAVISDYDMKTGLEVKWTPNYNLLEMIGLGYTYTLGNKNYSIGGDYNDNDVYLHAHSLRLQFGLDLAWCKIKPFIGWDFINVDGIDETSGSNSGPSGGVFIEL